MKSTGRKRRGPDQLADLRRQLAEQAARIAVLEAALAAAARRVICLIRLACLPGLFGAPRDVLTAVLSVHVGERVELPEIGERQYALFGLLWPRMLRRNIGQINVENVQN
jgi:hypothetical protein